MHGKPFFLMGKTVLKWPEKSYKLVHTTSGSPLPALLALKIVLGGSAREQVNSQLPPLFNPSILSQFPPPQNRSAPSSTQRRLP